jgi:hypothetical protein
MTLLEVVNENISTGLALFDKLTIKFFIRLAVDIVSIFILIRLIYYPNYKKRDMIFTYFAFNLIIFLITYMMNRVEMSIGAAFGLFAVFGILRYRTEGISIKDMTYLFLSIAIGLITAVAKGGWDELSLINSIILIMTLVLESRFIFKREL